jgi:hypothetical protein
MSTNGRHNNFPPGLGSAWIRPPRDPITTCPLRNFLFASISAVSPVPLPAAPGPSAHIQVTLGWVGTLTRGSVFARAWVVTESSTRGSVSARAWVGIPLLYLSCDPM